MVYALCFPFMFHFAVVIFFKLNQGKAIRFPAAVVFLIIITAHLHGGNDVLIVSVHTYVTLCWLRSRAGKLLEGFYKTCVQWPLSNSQHLIVLK